MYWFIETRCQFLIFSLYCLVANDGICMSSQCLHFYKITDKIWLNYTLAEGYRNLLFSGNILLNKFKTILILNLTKKFAWPWIHDVSSKSFVTFTIVTWLQILTDLGFVYPRRTSLLQFWLHDANCLIKPKPLIFSMHFS